MSGSDESPPGLRGEPARLAPAAIGIWAVRSLLTLIPAAFVSFVGSVPLPAIALLLLLYQVTHVVTWLRFTWQLDEHALVIDRGLLQRQRRVIPRDRIQSVDLERTLVHRVLGVIEVRVEAIGAGDTEGQLPALDPGLAELLRTTLLADAPRPGTDEPDSVDETVLVRCSPRDLLSAGITGGRVGVGAAILGLASQVAPPEWVAQVLLPGLEQFPDPLSLTGLRLLLFLFGLAAVVGFLASLVATFLVHWNFTLVETPGSLQVTRGLLTERRDTVPFHRIQAVRIEENWLRGLLGLASAKVVVAGRAGASRNTGSDLVLPIGSRAFACELAARILGRPPDVPDLVPMPLQARDRRRLRARLAALGAAFAGAGLGLASGIDAPWIPALVLGLGTFVSARWLANRAWTSLGWTDLGDHLLVREGALTRRTTLLPLSSIQELRSVSNPFQRRRDLATLELHIARPVGVLSVPRVLDLDDHDARVLRERWAARVAT